MSYNNDKKSNLIWNHNPPLKLLQGQQFSPPGMKINIFVLLMVSDNLITYEGILNSRKSGVLWVLSALKPWPQV